ncbi:MAG: HAD family acid phosphatase [Erythrobacter sp.]
MKTVLFDIDGTLADIEHRRHLVEGDNPDWAKFFDLMGSDSVNLPVAELYLALWSSTSFECVLVSGRPEEYRPVTEQWLTWNEIPFNRLLMRRAKDNRKDAIVKEEILKQLLSEGADIAFTVDDRQSVVNMWRRNGITCFQCAEYEG